MPTLIEPQSPQLLTDADLKPRGRVHPSPADWRDQVFYFLLPDRFSDGKERPQTLFDRRNPAAFAAADKAAWMRGGTQFQGGTLPGIRSKLGYLTDLGVTTLWIGPPWRQRADIPTYHGYAIQNFLEIDPGFGTRQDLRDLVDEAHDRGMYVLLDVIYNHTGNNWFYPGGCESAPYRFAPPHLFGAWRSAGGAPLAPHAPPAAPGDGVWPADFQDISWYTRAGQIGRWDPQSWEDPMHPHTEFRRGDFGTLKDLNHEADGVLFAVAQVYKYWIALSDCDGFRIDTVKHVSWETSRNFCGAIREYAESIGKERFLLLGEVTGGGEMTRAYLDVFGRNIDAALDIGDPSERLAGLAKGLRDPRDFFAQFQGHDALGSHRETGRYHVSILDDHDRVGRARERFATGVTRHREEQTAHAVGVQLTSLGMPCIYYGTEQAFDGSWRRHDFAIEPAEGDGGIPFEDRYIRECMFGGGFGAFQTAGCHFFDPSHPTYQRIAALARLRSRADAVGLTLRRGRQYLREIGADGGFRFPRAGEIVAWSRILNEQEVLVAINSNGCEESRADITVHAPWHTGSTMSFLYRGDWSEAELLSPPVDRTAPVVRAADGRVTAHLRLPPAGMAVLA